MPPVTLPLWPRPPSPPRCWTACGRHLMTFLTRQRSMPWEWCWNSGENSVPLISRFFQRYVPGAIMNNLLIAHMLHGVYIYTLTKAGYHNGRALKGCSEREKNMNSFIWIHKFLTRSTHYGGTLYRMRIIVHNFFKRTLKVQFFIVGAICMYKWCIIDRKFFTGKNFLQLLRWKNQAREKFSKICYFYVTLLTPAL